jgi:DNA polymerase V
MFSASQTTGFVSPAESYLSEPLSLQSFVQTNQPATFYMRTEGDQYQNLGLQDGDLLIIDRSLAPKSGCVCVCAIGDELGLVHYLKQSGKSILKTADGKIISSQRGVAVSLWGVVAYTVRKTY